jgi:pyruvate dehydrogenase E2 component (dihydrolipoamide acetyltransferase)
MAETIEVRVPNIGDFADIPVIEVLVKPGDVVAVEDPLVTLESEKATMEVPSPLAGTVQSVAVQVGDKVSEGVMLLALAPANGAGAAVTSTGAAEPAANLSASGAGVPASGAGVPAPSSPAPPETAPPAVAEAEPQSARQGAPEAAQAASPTEAEPAESLAQTSASAPDAIPSGAVHASPAIRRFARELGVDLRAVRGSGPHERVTREDIQGFVQRTLAQKAAAPAGATTGFDVLPWPKVDFARFGPIERAPLSRIRKLSGPNLARNWVMIPHVTNHDEADITELEAFRKELNAENPGAKVTVLAFVILAAVAALKAYPEVNSSLDGDALVLKRYYNVGFAADTPGGLVVPVLKAADTKGVLAIAAETSALAAKAREGKLSLGEMQGATFTISSLGGIGGTSFTPIINAPEVAILGVSRSVLRPVWNGSTFVPRLILPLSLSYDHRVIDGALAARFNVALVRVLGDLRRATL